MNEITEKQVGPSIPSSSTPTSSGLTSSEWPEGSRIPDYSLFIPRDQVSVQTLPPPFGLPAVFLFPET